MEKPFSDLKVVELSTVLAGPAVGMFFAEGGAQVTKFENKHTHGDLTRQWKVPGEETPENYSAYFASVNWGKSHQLLDLASKDDLSIVTEAIHAADILISNFKHGDDVKFGLTHERVKEINPNIIHGRILGFRSNPGRVAFDVVLQAECGFLSMSGTTDGQTAKMPVALIDLIAAHQLKEGILTALLQRQKPHKGSLVEVSLEEAAIASLANQGTNVLMGNPVPGKMGTLHPNIAPYGEVLKCINDLEIVLAVGTDAQFESLCIELDLRDLPTKSKFATNEQRVQHRNELNELLNNGSRARERDPLLNRLIEIGVPAGAIRTLDEVISSALGQSMIMEEEVNGVISRRLKSSIFKTIPN